MYTQKIDYLFACILVDVSLYVDMNITKYCIHALSLFLLDLFVPFYYKSCKFQLTFNMSMGWTVCMLYGLQHAVVAARGGGVFPAGVCGLPGGCQCLSGAEQPRAAPEAADLQHGSEGAGGLAGVRWGAGEGSGLFEGRGQVEGGACFCSKDGEF